MCVAVVMFAACATAYATEPPTGKQATIPAEWSTIWVQYNPTTLVIDTKGADDLSMTGFSIGYSKTIGLSKSTPLFLEVGAGLQYTYSSETYEDEDWDYEVKVKLFSIKVPVNLTYSWQISDKFSLNPYVGLQLRYNLSGKEKREILLYDEDAYDYYDEDELSQEYNLFDKSDMGSSDATWKRLQVGWQIGVNARFSGKFMVGLSYGSDFSEICKKVKVNTTSISLGYCF